MMKAVIKYLTGGESLVNNFEYLLISPGQGVSKNKFTKEEIKERVLPISKRYSFVGDRTVAVMSAEVSHVEFID